MTTDLYRLVLVLVLLWLVWAWHRGMRLPTHTAPVTALVQRLLKPRTPDDCPACRLLAATPAATARPRPLLRPWRELKNRRGARKRIDTQGLACPNRTCLYYLITDAQIHALVGDGRQGRCEPLQRLRCQACGTSFSSRRDYPLGDSALST